MEPSTQSTDTAAAAAGHLSRPVTGRCWVAVASAEHVRAGVEAGFMQVCHGKAGPLRRVLPGDRVVYYSPTTTFRGNDKLQAFTAIGRVELGEACQFDVSKSFKPFRRNVAWHDATETPIRPLLDRLAFTANKTGWGYQLRFGLFEIVADDMDHIAAAMRVEPNAHA